MNFRRMWQGKQLVALGVIVMITFVVLYNRLETKISNLQELSNKLATIVTRLQLRGLETAHSGFLQQQQRQKSEDRLGWNLPPMNAVVTAEVEEPGDDLVLIYNRVPKTASTSFMGVAYDLCSHNRFHVLHINVTKNLHVLSLADQARFVNNITSWNSMKPAIYHGHMAFLDFGRFGVVQKPVFINLIRKPLDRLVSYYYFLRNGDNFRPHVVRRKQGDKVSFDECVEHEEKDCDPDSMWLQIPFFCGHAADCWVPGNAWALEQAKRHLLQHYLLVGVTEELQDFVAMLEVTLPRFFKGGTKLFLEGKKSHLRKTFNKVEPSAETVAKIKISKVWQMENEFYEFAFQNFHFIKKRTLLAQNGQPTERGQQFMYEKIRPK